jgi:hypothetical protein
MCVCVCECRSFASLNVHMHPPYFFKINCHVILAMPDSFTWFHPSIFPTTATYAIISHHMCQFLTHLMPDITQHNGEHVTTSVGMYANTVGI